MQQCSTWQLYQYYMSVGRRDRAVINESARTTSGKKGLAMDARQRGIQILGWLAVIAGYGLALLLIRGIFVATTRGFFGAPITLWVFLGYLLFLAFAVYLFTMAAVQLAHPRMPIRGSSLARLLAPI
jgi:hypothetical protein